MESGCPFCGADTQGARCHRTGATSQRLSRTAFMAALTASMGDVAGCSSAESVAIYGVSINWTGGQSNAGTGGSWGTGGSTGGASNTGGTLSPPSDASADVDATEDSETSGDAAQDGEADTP